MSCQECLARVSSKSVQVECLARASCQERLGCQECPVKSLQQERLTRVSSVSYQDFVASKSVKKECFREEDI